MEAGNVSTSTKPNRVLYSGFGPAAGRLRPEVGGFVTGTRMVVESPLFDHTTFRFCPYTHPGEGGLVRRILEDVRRFRACLREHDDCSVVMLQVAQYRGTYREWAFARLARRAQRRLVLDIRAGGVLSFLERDSDPFVRLLFRRLLEASDVALVQCSAFIPELRRRYPTVRFEWFPNFVPEARCRQREGPLTRPGEPLRAVYFGNYSTAKGVPAMIEAAARLRSRGLDVELHLAGEGRDEAVRACIAGADPGLVIDHGMLQQRELWALLDRMHVFLFPTSHWGEGHSNSLNEALMAGLAVVATRHNQNPFVLPEQDTLWLDSDALVDSLERHLTTLAKSPDLLNRVGPANQRYVRERFSDRRWIPFLEARFDELRGGPVDGVRANGGDPMAAAAGRRLPEP